MHVPPPLSIGSVIWLDVGLGNRQWERDGHMEEVTPSQPRPMGGRVRQTAIAVLALVLIGLGVYTLWHFLSALVWAGIFAIALWPLYRRMINRFGTGRFNVAMPSLFTLGVALIFIVPLIVVGVQMAHELHAGTEWLRDVERDGLSEPDSLRNLPFMQSQVADWWQQNLADPGSARELVERLTRGHVADVSRLIIVQMARRLTLFAFTLLTLFFLFRNGESVLRQIRRAIVRLFGPGGERIAQRMVESVHGTVDGLVLVGLGVGVILGIAYIFAGVPQPVLFGMVTAVAAMIPLAAPVVFSIAALILAAQGSIAWGVGVFATGVIVTFVADHFIRPALIGGTTKLPFLWVLLGILGGVESWGLIGLFLGPAVMSALMSLWREWVHEEAETGA
jgi:predicted PurR-regulated permease PerM